MADFLDKGEELFKLKIAQRLVEVREMTGLNKAAFGLEIGLDRQSVSRIEKGTGTSIYMISKYCKVSKISLADFFTSPLFKDV